VHHGRANALTGVLSGCGFVAGAILPVRSHDTFAARQGARTPPRLRSSCPFNASANRRVDLLIGLLKGRRAQQFGDRVAAA
jgi:hypothetical protein